MHCISIFLLFSFKLMEETLKYILYKVIKDLIFIIPQFYAKDSDYRAVRLSILTQWIQYQDILLLQSRVSNVLYQIGSWWKFWQWWIKWEHLKVVAAVKSFSKLSLWFAYTYLYFGWNSRYIKYTLAKSAQGLMRVSETHPWLAAIM